MQSKPFHTALKSEEQFEVTPLNKICFKNTWLLEENYILASHYTQFPHVITRTVYKPSKSKSTTLTISKSKWKDVFGALLLWICRHI